MKVATQFLVEPMRVEHIPAVSAIERLSFTQPWPPNAYRREILENRMAHYLVVRDIRDQEEGTAPSAAGADAGIDAAPIHDGILQRLTRLLRGPEETPPSPEVARELRQIVGYAGLWLMTDEAHITTIASHPDMRGQGVGELLLLGLIDRALAISARWLTLEVRASNTVAQNLYRKYTFKEMGVRRRYYSDNGEDALVMWTEALDSSAFLEALNRNERRLAQRLDAEIHLGGRHRSLSRG